MKDGRNYSFNGSKYNKMQYQISTRGGKSQSGGSSPTIGCKVGAGREASNILTSLLVSSAHDKKVALLGCLEVLFVSVGEPS